MSIGIERHPWQSLDYPKGRKARWAVGKQSDDLPDAEKSALHRACSAQGYQLPG